MVVFAHHLGLPLGDLVGVRLEVDLDVGVGLLAVGECQVLGVVDEHAEGGALVAEAELQLSPDVVRSLPVHCRLRL